VRAREKQRKSNAKAMQKQRKSNAKATQQKQRLTSGTLFWGKLLCGRRQARAFSSARAQRANERQKAPEVHCAREVHTVFEGLFYVRWPPLGLSRAPLGFALTWLSLRHHLDLTRTSVCRRTTESGVSFVPIRIYWSARGEARGLQLQPASLSCSCSCSCSCSWRPTTSRPPRTGKPICVPFSLVLVGWQRVASFHSTAQAGWSLAPTGRLRSNWTLWKTGRQWAAQLSVRFCSA